MYSITLIPGDGIGPEVSYAAQQIIEATGVKIQWETVNAGAEVYEKTGTLVPDSVYESIEKNKIALKGPIATPIGSGFRSINVSLRKKYDLYSNIRPVKSMDGLNHKFDNINIVIFRENTEGLYCGVEEQISVDEAHAIKIITRKASMRIAKSAFDYAKAHGISKVTVAHKANIMKLSDGLFLNCARTVAEEYPTIELQEVIIDNMCMQLVMYPEKYGVIVTTNLYGDILSDLCAGLIGGLGMIPGANIGSDIAIFEAVHGSAPDIAGQQKANPIALTLSGAMMLDYLGETEKADKIRSAIETVVKEGKYLTGDLGGTSSTQELTDRIIHFIKN